jgi:hypothetical protein
MEFKTTTKLFRGKYQYKIVLVCSAATYFRSGDMSTTLESLKNLSLDDLSKKRFSTNLIRSQDDLDYAFKLQSTLSKLKDIDIRVEAPWISVYTTNRKDCDSLSKLDENRVKYISQPSKNLEEGTILMPKMDYDYRITLGKTTQEHSAFIEWAESNAKLKLPAGCKKDLLKDRTWGGKHFYLSGDNNLLMAKMHLGGSIAKVERIVK